MSLIANEITAGSGLENVIINGGLNVNGSANILDNLTVGPTGSSGPVFAVYNSTFYGSSVAINGELNVNQPATLTQGLTVENIYGNTSSIGSTGSTGGYIYTEIDLVNGINITNTNVKNTGQTTTTLFQNTLGTSISKPSTFLIQDVLGNKILENLTQTGLFLNNLATTTEVLSQQSISGSSGNYQLAITYPFTSLINVSAPSNSEQYNFNLSLTDLPFTENIFLPNKYPGSNGQSITVVMVIPFIGYANSITLNYNISSTAIAEVPISSDQIFTYNYNNEFNPCNPGLSGYLLLQTVSIFYNPQTSSTYTNPLYNPSSYTFIVEFNSVTDRTDLFTSSSSSSS